MTEADENRYRLQAVLETAVDGIITIDERGIIQSANPAVGRLFGFETAGELVGRNVSILMPPLHGQQHDEYIAHYLRTGEARVVGIGRELEAVRRDGSVFPIELAVSEVPGDGARYFTGIIRDISARKQAEEALRESQARIQAVLNTAVDGILTIDERGVIESANPAVGRLFGYDPAELIGRNISMLMPADHARAHDGYIERYLQNRRSARYGHRPGGGGRCDATARRFRRNSRSAKCASVTSVVSRASSATSPSARQAEEALLRADAMKDEFLANTSHELRTPLNGIIGIGQSMLDGATGPLTEEQRRNLAMIVASGRRLANLVNDLLDFSKLRHETVELHRRPTDLHALTELVLTISRTLVGKRALRLFNRIDAQVPLVEVDEDRAQQILFNLVGNAVKFTPAGAVEVSAEVRDQWLDLTVSDTGIGIGAERLETIFELVFAGRRIGCTRTGRHRSRAGHQQAAGRTSWRKHQRDVGGRGRITLHAFASAERDHASDAHARQPAGRTRQPNPSGR